MSDGANCIIVAKVGWLPNQVAIVGGNCSVTILDAHGTEIFWTVMGGIVTSLAVFDFDGDGENEVDVIYYLCIHVYIFSRQFYKFAFINLYVLL